MYLQKLGPSLVLTWSDISYLECFTEVWKDSGNKKLGRGSRGRLALLFKGLGVGLRKEGNWKMKKACVLPQERGILEQGDYVLACRAS